MGNLPLACIRSPNFDGGQTMLNANSNCTFHKMFKMQTLKDVSSLASKKCSEIVPKVSVERASFNIQSGANNVVL